MYIPLLLPAEEVAVVAHILTAVSAQQPTTALGKKCFEIGEKIHAALKAAEQVSKEG